MTVDGLQARRESLARALRVSPHRLVAIRARALGAWFRLGPHKLGLYTGAELRMESRKIIVGKEDITFEEDGVRHFVLRFFHQRQGESDVEHRQSSTDFYRQTPPDLDNMQRIISEINDERFTLSKWKRAPTGDEVCLLASLASSHAWLSMQVQGPNARTLQDRIHEVALPLSNAFEWEKCPFEYDVTTLLSALKGGSASDLRAEWTRLHTSGVPLFQIEMLGDTPWLTSPLPPPP